MAAAQLSHCCQVELYHDGFGHTLCGKCWNASWPIQRDLIGWLFPAESGKRPHSEPVLVRYGRRIELLRPDQVRGNPDGWTWNDV